jgi:ANTAR domain
VVEIADARAAATRFGPYAAVAAGNLHAYQAAHSKADNLQAALETRATIDQAKGVLIERFKLTPDQAFQMLTQVSMHANRKVRDIADELVHTGEVPVVPARGGGRTSRLTSGLPSAPPNRGTAPTAPAERDTAGRDHE